MEVGDRKPRKLLFDTQVKASILYAAKGRNQFPCTTQVTLYSFYSNSLVWWFLQGVIYNLLRVTNEYW